MVTNSNSRYAQASLGVYSDRRLRCNGRSSTSVVCDAQYRRHWLACPFLMLSLHDSRGLPVRRIYTSTVPCSVILAAYRDGRRGRIMITYNAWQLAIKVSDVRRRCWPVSIHIRSFGVLCMKCQASACSICLFSKALIRLSRSAMGAL